MALLSVFHYILPHNYRSAHEYLLSCSSTVVDLPSGTGTVGIQLGFKVSDYLWHHHHTMEPDTSLTIRTSKCARFCISSPRLSTHPAGHWARDSGRHQGSVFLSFESGLIHSDTLLPAKFR